MDYFPPSPEDPAFVMFFLSSPNLYFTPLLACAGERPRPFLGRTASQPPLPPRIGPDGQWEPVDPGQTCQGDPSETGVSFGLA